MARAIERLAAQVEQLQCENAELRNELDKHRSQCLNSSMTTKRAAKLVGTTLPVIRNRHGKQVGDVGASRVFGAFVFGTVVEVIDVNSYRMLVSKVSV